VASVYIHIPYCDSKCPYCDFNSHAVKRWPEDEYAAALIAELRFYAERDPWRGAAVDNIFLGGGTPSLFAPRTIAALLGEVDRLWPGGRGEVTMEANPGTTTEAKLSGFCDAGVGRISFGVQSFNDEMLRRLGRIHDAAQAADAIVQARRAGFENLNLDLIFAVPGQTVAEWEADLHRAVELGPDHISAYNLTFEDGTAFTAQRDRGLIESLPEEVEVAMFSRAREILAAAGYEHYEISNYARPGRACRHNLNYWKGGEYLGVGAGAHSFAHNPGRGRRWSNERGPQAYIEAIRRGGEACVFEESLDERQARGEFVFLSLRCLAGFDDSEFSRRFDVEFDDAFPHHHSLLRDGLLERDGSRWRLTERGLHVADGVFATFL
jgi:oxygen-independent coproporphyrinogen-3 oxidase